VPGPPRRLFPRSKPGVTGARRQGDVTDTAQCAACLSGRARLRWCRRARQQCRHHDACQKSRSETRCSIGRSRSTSKAASTGCERRPGACAMEDDRQFSTSVVGTKLETYSCLCRDQVAVETMTAILSRNCADATSRSMPSPRGRSRPTSSSPANRQTGRAHGQDEPMEAHRNARGYCLRRGLPCWSDGGWTTARWLRANGGLV